MANTLLPGNRLNVGDHLDSNSNQFFLIYQPDGNLVVYDRTVTPNKPLWSSKTAGDTPGYVSMQWDGNLVIYNVANQHVWSTGTFLPSKKGMSLVLQDDGNLVLYGITALFSSFNDGSLSPQPTAPAGQEGGNGVNLTSVTEAAGAVLNVVFSLL